MKCQQPANKRLRTYNNGKTRPIRCKHSTFRHFIDTGAVRVDRVHTDKNLVDPLTKGLEREKIYKSS